MTEGQKALSQFIAFANKHAPNKVDEITSAISEIKKLVDRDVPKPLVHEFGEVCQSCGRTSITDGGNKDNYCPNCGQKLKGSES